MLEIASLCFQAHRSRALLGVMLCFMGIAFGLTEQSEISSEPETLWVSQQSLPFLGLPSRSSLLPSIGNYRYSVTNTMIQYNVIPNLFEHIDYRSRKSPVLRVFLTFTSEFNLSLVTHDSLYTDVNLANIFRRDRDGGHPFNTFEDFSFLSNSELHREQNLVYRHTELYNLESTSVNTHFHSANFSHNQQGYNQAKHHLTSSTNSDSIYSIEQSFAIDNEQLSQNSKIDVLRWITMNLPGHEATIYGARSDSLTNCETTFLRASTLEQRIPVKMGRNISLETSDFLSVGDFWGSCFDRSSTDIDTLAYNKSIYLYVHPIIRSSQVEQRNGLIFYIPVAGRLACSLLVNHTPSLEEFTWAGIDAALIITSQIWLRKVPAVGQADEIFNGVVNRSIRTPNSSTHRASTQLLRRTLESAGRSSGPGQIHHIVPWSATRGNMSREILQKFGVGIDDAINLVPLPSHFGAHSAAYYREVERALIGAASKSDVLQALNYLRESLVSGSLLL